MSLQNLDKLIRAIAQSVMGDTTPPSSSDEADKNAFFEELSAAARTGQQQFFRELVATENQTRKQNEPTLLMAVVIEGRIEIVQALIAAGADVNVRIKQFFTFDALEFAVDKGYTEIARILLEAGADPNWNDPGLRPLTKAIKANNPEMLQLLLNAGAEVTFSTGFNPLVEAANKTNNAEIIQLLLEAGCPVNSTNTSGDSALVDACLNGHDRVVHELIAAGADVNQPRKDGVTPLIAVFSVPQMVQALASWGLGDNHSDPRSRMAYIMQLLVDAGVNLDTRHFQGQTALMLAAEQGYLDIANILLAKGAAPNVVEDPAKGTVPDLFKDMAAAIAEQSDRKTALIYAADKGHTEIVAALLAAGANVAIADKKGRTALEIAVQQGHADIVQLLQSAGAEAPEGATQFSTAALLGAAKQGNVAALRSALQAGINPDASEVQERRNPRHKTALMFAAERGHIEAVRVLLEAGASVNLSDRPGKKLGKTPLMVAAESDHAEVMRLLLESGATVDAQDKRGETALFYAVQEETTEAVRVLLEFGADPHKKSWDGTPFEQATYASPEISKLVMAADKQKGGKASTAAREEMLRSAAFDENAELVRTLVPDVTNLDAPDHSGWTALIFAAAKGTVEVVQMLLAAGANVNKTSNSGQTALSEAVYWGHVETVKLLIAAGADVNVRDNDGWTPLMKALTWNATEVVQVLIDAGADLSLRNRQGKTALALAVEDKKRAIAQLLRTAGATE
ncbi:ankyrin repeat domain-containing protein [Kovacikia minuta CCNUW1]|uniref:ankyrin repeat domain-containing protein n=1 Tax=Kovacikia minuta TaxID=2931930 RepID=UPI001CCE8469|nr:ankyrin repeat domain-containing protein [Kovacikia minuta]UBF27121.1 ankyrin repeat domain-containing protein [Kovacikia minuta CCNUW1]